MTQLEGHQKVYLFIVTTMRGGWVEAFQRPEERAAAARVFFEEHLIQEEEPGSTEADLRALTFEELKEQFVDTWGDTYAVWFDEPVLEQPAPEQPAPEPRLQRAAELGIVRPVEMYVLWPDKTWTDGHIVCIPAATPEYAIDAVAKETLWQDLLAQQTESVVAFGVYHVADDEAEWQNWNDAATWERWEAAGDLG